MAKSKIERLNAALEKGDIEVAKQLAKEVAEATSKKAPRKPAKVGAVKKGGRVRAKPIKPAEEPTGLPTSSIIVLPEDDRYVAPQRRQDGQSGGDGEWLASTRHLGQVKARHQSMQGRQHHNEFDDWVKAQGKGVDAPTRVKQLDKKLSGNATLTPRPGMPGAKRPPAVKNLTYCDGCGRPFHVYPSELRIIDNESVYKCDRCIRRGK